MAPITQFSQLDLNAHYTYADYLLWQFKDRVELIRGKVFKMSPAPNVKHQRIAAYLNFRLYAFFEHTSCQVFPSPFDVRLTRKDKASDRETTTVVQPDLCVVCDLSKLDERGCNGAPDLAIEILSPGNTRREMREKYEVYEEAGVREYWMVDPSEKIVLIYVLNEQGRYIGLQPLTEDVALKSTIFPELSIPLEEVFREIIV